MHLLTQAHTRRQVMRLAVFVDALLAGGSCYASETNPLPPILLTSPRNGL